MNTANMPGFNAEASMYMASNTYRAAHAAFADVASARVIPQQCRLLCQVVCPPPQQCCPTGWRCCGSCESGQCDDVCVRPGQSCP
jgi:hypothetical protein